MQRRPVLLLVAALAAACHGPRSPATDGAAAGVAAARWTCSSRVELANVWALLRARHDADGDGRVTAAEYGRDPDRFANFDRDGDGVLAAADFPPGTFFNGFNAMLVGRADKDGDARVTRAEWDAFADRFDPDGDGAVTAAEVAAVLGPWASDRDLFLLAFDQDGDGGFDRRDLELAFGDQDHDGDAVLTGAELRGWRPAGARPEVEPPAVGAQAPDFELPFSDESGRTFALRAQCAEAPVALVFGSYT